MKFTRSRGSTGNSCVVFLPDTASTGGAGKAGLTNTAPGLTITVRREKATGAITYSGANINTIAGIGTWAAPGSGKVNFGQDSGQPGMYEIQFEDSLFSTGDGSRYVSGMVQATGVAPTPFEIQLTATDQQDATRAGMTALPNANASTNGGLLIIGSNNGNLRLLGGSFIVDSGISANLSGSVGSVVAPVTAGTVSDKAGYALAGTQAFNNTGTWTGNLTGSVGSVTGRVSLLMADTMTGTAGDGSVGGALLAANAVPGSVLDVAASGHNTAGTIGAKINSAAAATDPLSVTVPAGYAAGTVGYLIGNNLNASVSSRSTYAGTDTAGTTTLLGRLTGTRATNLDNLDAAVSSRSMPSAAQVIDLGTTLPGTAGANSIGEALKFADTRLDATVSSRSTYAGGDTAGTTTLLARVGSPVGASLSADVAGVKADTGTLTTRLPQTIGFTSGNVNAHAIDGTVTTVTAPVLLTPGTGTGMISLASGQVSLQPTQTFTNTTPASGEEINVANQ